MRRLIGCLVAATVIPVLVGCGGDSSNEAGPKATDGASVSASPSASETPSSEPTYSFEDRAEFLASAPDCAQLKGWFEQFPADEDANTVVTYVRACNDLPPAFADRPELVAGKAELVRALLEVDAPKGSPVRTAAYAALANEVCGILNAGSQSMWQVQDKLQRKFGAQPEDYAAAVEGAVDVCVRHQDTLTLFETDNPMGVAAAMRQYVEQQWPGASQISTDGEYAALAATVCDGLRSGESLTLASTLGNYIVEGSGDAVGQWSAEHFCPSLL